MSFFHTISLAPLAHHMKYHFLFWSYYFRVVNAALWARPTGSSISSFPSSVLWFSVDGRNECSLPRFRLHFFPDNQNHRHIETTFHLLYNSNEVSSIVWSWMIFVLFLFYLWNDMLICHRLFQLFWSDVDFSSSKACAANWMFFFYIFWEVPWINKCASYSSKRDKFNIFLSSHLVAEAHSEYSFSKL